MSNEYFATRVSDGVAEIVLNRPNKLNVMDDGFFRSFKQVVQDVNARDDVRVLLIYAEGKVFTAGLDLKAAPNLLKNDPNQSQATNNVALWKMIREWQESVASLRRINKPSIVAVHNLCIGGGVDFITAADIRLCTKDAQFSVRETKIAMVADLGTIQRLCKLVPSGFAREMIFSGEPVSAERALRFGLVNEVYEDKQQMLAAARALARSIAENSPLAVQGSKFVLRYAEEHTEEEGLEQVALWNTGFLQSQDLQEAVMSFLTKKKPVFTAKL